MVVLPVFLGVLEAPDQAPLLFLSGQIQKELEDDRAVAGQMLLEIVDVVDGEWEQTIYHKDLLPVVFVTGDMAGHFDSPLYGMFELVGKASELDAGGQALEQWTGQ